MLAFFLVSLGVSSCKQAIDLPQGVEVLVNGQSIDGEKEVVVSQGQEVRLEASGLEGNSAINVKIRKLGIRVYEDDFTASSEGIVNETFTLPDMEAKATAVVAYTDMFGVAYEDKFTIVVQ